MEDSVDRHIARWRGRAPFDDRVEEIITRIQMLNRHVRRVKDRALAETGLQMHEFETLHRLVSRGKPWRATPSELAAELAISPAGMTGRLDGLEGSGLVRRIRSEEDRRRVDVELTDLGHARWFAAIKLRGVAETGMVDSLTRSEQDTLNALLKRLLINVENAD